jgi:hypothetical protein
MLDRLTVLVLSATVVAATLVTPEARAQSRKAEYLDYIRKAAEQGERDYDSIITNWKQNIDPNPLWGYNPPTEPIYLADIEAFLFKETGDRTRAEWAARLLSEFSDLRAAYPADFVRARVEYANGLPALGNFFLLAPYARAHMLIRDSGVLDPATRRKIEATLAHSLDFVFHFPEWGAHNRAIVRAEALLVGARALPDHPHAARWLQMARTIAYDNLSNWQAEDATIYHPVFLQSLMAYAEITGREDVFDRPFLRYYAEYFKRQFTPFRNMPDYGDANWDPSWFFYIAALEKLAARYADRELKWVVESFFDRASQDYPKPSPWAASSLALAYRWTDDAIQPVQPTSASQDVLDDIVGKKIVFRSGWEPSSTYLLLNYRDEGDGAFNTREFLRHTISVEEEKMHHGNSDENSIVMLADGGSLLLHDGGYRDGLPSGAFGGYRADYFHNRLVARKDKRDRSQTVPDFFRTSGAYRPVRTHKVDFLAFADVELSRTRLSDAAIGYDADRIIAWLKPQHLFLVIDAVKVRQTDYYTFTNLWHTQTLHARGPHYYDTSIDSIQSVKLPRGKRLLIQFLDNQAKEDSLYTERRHFQEEKAIYQTQSSHYRAGDWEVFVTVLTPHDSGAAIAPLLDRVRVLEGTRYPEAVGFEIRDRDRVSYVGVKLDLESEVVRENIRPRYTWEAGRTKYGPIETDAHFLYATMGAGSLRYAASEVLKVLYDGKALLEALPNTHGLQLDGSPDRVGYVKWRFWEDEVRTQRRE